MSSVGFGFFRFASSDENVGNLKPIRRVGKAAGAGLSEPEGAVDLMGAPFPAAPGCQGAKLAGGDAHGAPLTARSRRKS